MEKLNWFSTLHTVIGIDLTATQVATAGLPSNTAQAVLPSNTVQAALPLLLLVANVLGVGMILPQALRLRRDRCVDGVSGSWVGVGLTLNLWWVGYGLKTQLWGVLPVSAGAFALYAAIGVLLVSITGRSAYRQLLFGMIVLGGAPLPFLIIGGWELAGVAIGLCYGVQFLPAAIAAYRSPSVAGISGSTWAMAWVEAAIWLLYGFDTSDRALLFGGGGGLVVSSFILLVLATSSRARPVERPASLATH